MNDLLRDLRYAWRRLLSNRGLTAVAVLSLALGIGANTTIFSFVNAVFLRPLKVERPNELVAMFTDDSTFPNHLLPVSYLNYVDYRSANIFKGLAAEVRLQLNLGDGNGPPERIAGASVTANYFDVLGVKPLHGRTFTQDEEAPVDAHPVIVLSANLWRHRFGADPSVVGRTIQVNGNKYTVVGIAGEGFRGATLLATYDAWVPMTQRKGIVGYLERWFDARQASMAAVYGRLRSEGDFDHAQAATATVSERLASEYPKENHTRKAVLIPFAQATLNPNQRGQVVRMGWFLTIMVALVLALACTNVANLLLSRALARQREVAVRIAIGAGRGRLIRQLLTESLLLALVGGA
ncbi:MAG TPA: ABC transporter permease, partial [Thermoanaerobaculia bacterium]